MATVKRIVDNQITKTVEDYAAREKDSILSDRPPIINHYTGFNGGGLGWQENQCMLLNLLLDNKDGLSYSIPGWISKQSTGEYPNWVEIGIDCNEKGEYEILYKFSPEEVQEGIEYLAEKIRNNEFCYGRGATRRSKQSVLSRITNKDPLDTKPRKG